jgi:hypothetical protein
MSSEEFSFFSPSELKLRVVKKRGKERRKRKYHLNECAHPSTCRLFQS